MTKASVSQWVIRKTAAGLMFIIHCMIRGWGKLRRLGERRETDATCADLRHASEQARLNTGFTGVRNAPSICRKQCADAALDAKVPRRLDLSS